MENHHETGLFINLRHNNINFEWCGISQIRLKLGEVCKQNVIIKFYLVKIHNSVMILLVMRTKIKWRILLCQKKK